MVTVEYLVALIGTLLFKTASSASINYEPIKITVNENFNSQPGQVSTELQGLEPGTLHQVANFYIKPQMNLPQSFIPSHIEALISLIQEHRHSCAKDASKVVVEKDKLIEILQPFMYPLSEISKGTQLKNVLEKEKNFENVVIDKIVTEPAPAIMTEESNPVTQEFLVIPEAPVLPKLSINDISAIIEKAVKKEESAILEETMGEFSTIPEIAVRPIKEAIINSTELKPANTELEATPEAPVLPALSGNDIKLFEDGLKISEKVVDNIQSKLAIQEHAAIPEAPTLSPVTLNDVSSFVGDMKKEISIIYKKPTEVFSTIPEIVVRPIQEPTNNYIEPDSMTSELLVIPEAPVLPPLSGNDIHFVEEVKNEEPLVVDVDPKPVIQELIIPETPTLSPLSFNGISSLFDKEEKKEALVIVNNETSAVHTVPEKVETPIKEPFINFVEPKFVISELIIIPEVPASPSLSYDDILPHFEKEMNKEETVIVDGQRGVFPTIPEITVRPIQESIITFVEPKPNTEFELVNPEAPVLPQFSSDDIKLIGNGVKFNEPTVIDVEPKLINTAFRVIPEAPVLPPLSANDMELIKDGVKTNENAVAEVESKPAIQEYVEIPETPVLPPLKLHNVSPSFVEEMEKEVSIIFKEPTRAFSTIPEIMVRPIQEPINNYIEPEYATSELLVIPEAPVLPPLSAADINHIEDRVKFNEPTFVDVEPKPITTEFEVIPEAPVLPPLSATDIKLIEDEVKFDETIVVDAEPQPINTEFQVIPEAPVLPSLSANDIKVIESGVKINEPIIIDVEPKPVNTEFQVIPEAPVLPPLSANDIKLIEDGVKFNEPIVVDVEPIPINTELQVIPEAPELPPLSANGIILSEDGVKFDETIVVEAEPKPINTEFQVIPEAPVLLPLSANDMELIKDGVKTNENAVVEVESKPAIQEYVEIPEAPVLPPLKLHNVSPSFVEEMEKEVSIIFKEPTRAFSTIPEIMVRPIQEPINNYIEPEYATSELLVIPEAPVLPPLSAADINLIEDRVKFNEPTFVDVEPKPITTEFEVIPEAPVLPPLSATDIKLIEDEVKFDETIVVDAEPQPINTEFQVIPEAPVLPSLSANDIKLIEDGVKFNEPIVIDAEPKPINTEFQVIPDAPVLPPLSANDIKLIEDGVNFNEPIKTEFQVIPEAPVLPPLSANDIKLIEDGVNFNEPIVIDAESKPIKTEFQVIPEAPVLPPLSANDIKLIEDGVKFNEPIVIDAEPKPIKTKFQEIPHAPVLPPLSANDIKLSDDGVKINEPIVVESKPSIQEYVVIPEAPVLPPLSLHDLHTILEEDVKKEEPATLEKSASCSSALPKESVGPIPKPIVNYDEPKPTSSKLGIIPEAPVLPPLSTKDIHLIEEAVKVEEPVSLVAPFISNHLVIPEAPILPDLTIKRIPANVEEVTIEESITVEESMGKLASNPEISGRPTPMEDQGPIVVPESSESFALENNIFPVSTEEVKIEIPILLEETIEVFPPIAEISSEPTRETFQEPEMTNSYVLEEVHQPNPDNVLTIKETLPPTIIPKPSNNLGVFSYAPFVTHLSNHAPKTNKLKIAKPASLERFLIKKHPFRLPVTPFPRLSLNAMKNSIWENKKQFLYPTSYAHDVVEKRIAPNMAFKNNGPPKRVKIYLRSQVPKGPSYL